MLYKQTGLYGELTPMRSTSGKGTSASGFGAAEQDLDQLTGLFHLLSDKTRLNIVLLLASGERNVGNLCEALKLPQPTVSHHLGLLRMSNVIGSRRAGKQVFYGVNGRIDMG